MNWIPKIIYPSGGGTTITFDLPAEGDPLGEKMTASNITTTSTDGSLQNIQNYQEELIDVKVSYQTKTTADAFRTFFESHASEKKSFDYYSSSDEAITGVYTMVDNSIDFDRQAPGAGSDFIYGWKFKIRKVK
jgi:glutamine phosphoribosylpyrophosphate amidotransferase